jgi:hypothetical protein
MILCDPRRPCFAGLFSLLLSDAVQLGLLVYQLASQAVSPMRLSVMPNHPLDRHADPKAQAEVGSL